MARIMRRRSAPLQRDGGTGRIRKLRRLVRGHDEIRQAIVRCRIDRPRVRADWRRRGHQPAARHNIAAAGDEPDHMADVLLAGGHANRSLCFERGVMHPAGRIVGAGEGNRTLVCSLGSCRSTIELHPRRGSYRKPGLSAQSARARPVRAEAWEHPCITLLLHQRRCCSLRSERSWCLRRNSLIG
jgi:hypothetical protein